MRTGILLQDLVKLETGISCNIRTWADQSFYKHTYMHSNCWKDWACTFLWCL